LPAAGLLDPDTLRAAAAALNLPAATALEDEARVPGDLRLRVVANATPAVSARPIRPMPARSSAPCSVPARPACPANCTAW
jgi:4-hydroxythreonine-4-phosphate dehydrogenase